MLSPKEISSSSFALPQFLLLLLPLLKIVIKMLNKHEN
jgi:hypothetical protein